MFSDMHLWLKVLLAVASAFLVAFGTTPIVKAFAQKVGAIDNPGEARRIHNHPIPRMGGLAIFLGFLVSVILFAEITVPVRGILIGAVIIVATGAVDDIVSLKYWIKLIAQIAAAVIAVAHGVTTPNWSKPISLVASFGLDVSVDSDRQLSFASTRACLSSRRPSPFTSRFGQMPSC